MAYSILMAKQTPLPLADGYSALILTNSQLHALRWLLNRDEVREMLYELDPYVNEDIIPVTGYLGLKPIIERVQGKIDEQFASEPLV